MTKKYSNKEETYRKLHRYLLQNIFAAGERIPSERQISEELDVNRTTLRLAIHKMVNEGILERRIGSGTFVKFSSYSSANRGNIESDKANALEVIELRIVLEPQVTLSSMDNISPKQISDLRNFIKNSKVDVIAEEQDLSFNESLSNISTNKILKKMYTDLCRIRRKNLRKIFDPSIGESSPIYLSQEELNEYLEQIVYAMEARQPQIAEEAVRKKLKLLLEKIVY